MAEPLGAVGTAVCRAAALGSVRPGVRPPLASGRGSQGGRAAPWSVWG